MMTLVICSLYQLSRLPVELKYVSTVKNNSINRIQKPVLMLISVFNILIALADGDYIIMIALMALYNVGECEWEYLHTPPYRICKYWNILIITYSLLYINSSRYIWTIWLLHTRVSVELTFWHSSVKVFHVVAISIPRDFSLYNTGEFRGFPRIHDDFHFCLHMALQDRKTTGPVAVLTTVVMPATARSYRNKIYFKVVFHEIFEYI